MRRLFKVFIIIAQVSVLSMLGLMSSCQQQDLNTQSDEKYKTMTNQNLEIWNTGNIALIDELYSPDYIRSYFNGSTEVKGIDAIKEYVKATRTAYPDFNVTLDELIISGNRIVVRWTSAGTNTGLRTDENGEFPPTGNKVKFSGVSICTVVDNKLTEELVYMDDVRMLEQLGYTIMPPQNASQL